MTAGDRLSAAKLWLTATGAGDAPYLAAVVFAMPTVLTRDVADLAADDRSAAPRGCAVVAAVLGREAAALPATPEWASRVECVL